MKLQYHDSHRKVSTALLCRQVSHSVVAGKHHTDHENHCCHDDVCLQYVHSDGAVARVLTSMIILSSSSTSSVKMAEAREHTTTSSSTDAAAAAAATVGASIAG